MKDHLYFIILIALSSCTKSEISFDDKCFEDYLGQTYSNEDIGFTISAPEDYRMDTAVNDFTITAVRASTNETEFESFAITVISNIAKRPLYYVYESELESLESDESYGLNLLGKGPVQWDSYECYYILFEDIFENETKVTQLHFYFAENDVFLNLLFIVDSKDFERLKCKFNSILGTLAFT